MQSVIMMKAKYSSHCLVLVTLLSSLWVFGQPARANVYLPSIFSSHMVLQRDLANPVWGWARPGEKVTVTIGTQHHETVAGADGAWRVKLNPMAVGGTHTLVVKGDNTVKCEDVVVGEVWVCSGQSNMQLPVQASNDPDLEIRTADYPDIRLITVPQIGTQQPQDDFYGEWERCTPQTVADFSAVGYFFGRLLHQSLKIPIGLIDNSWGGSAAEAWVRRDALAAEVRYRPLLDNWVEQEKKEDLAKAMADFEGKLVEWRKAVAQAKSAGQESPPPPGLPGNNPLAGNQRPGNIYNGVLKPTIGYGIRGAIWYQGESNAGRAYQYRHLFPLMIQLWRDDWGQGNFPFYWVQLADFQNEPAEPGDSDWAELREAQTMTMSKLPNTGEAVIIDIGEGRDIHPRNKQDVAKRLARWALARDYGFDIVCRSPTYNAMAKKENKIVLTFDHVGRGLYSFDKNDVVGFTIAGEDKKFVWAQAKITATNQVEVWSDQVANPVAVRYAWATNPVCNLQSRDGLPVTPFRTDDWPGVTTNNRK
jgi:sialate O-acetylesterase